MNERYLSHGKRKDNGEWITGYYVCVCEHHYIFTGKLDITRTRISFECYEVIHETVGQCTGLKDKNGKLIFEGDILHIKTGKGWNCPNGTDIYYKVVFTEFNEQCDECTEYIGFMAECIDDDEYSIQYLVRAYEAEVVGNIHDNPELLEVER